MTPSAFPFEDARVQALLAHFLSQVSGLQQFAFEVRASPSQDLTDQ